MDKKSIKYSCFSSNKTTKIEWTEKVTWGADEIKRNKKVNGRVFRGKQWNEFPDVLRNPNVRSKSN